MTGTEQIKFSKCTNCQSQTKVLVKFHHFENCKFYKDVYGEQARHARSAHLPYKTL